MQLTLKAQGDCMWSTSESKRAVGGAEYVKLGERWQTLSDMALK